MGEPDHAPAAALSVEPTEAVPEIVGSAVFVGEVTAGTRPVGNETATAEPEVFEAVTVARSVDAPSAATTV
jgi:hypothetical protein